MEETVRDVPVGADLIASFMSKLVRRSSEAALIDCAVAAARECGCSEPEAMALVRAVAREYVKKIVK